MTRLRRDIRSVIIYIVSLIMALTMIVPVYGEEVINVRQAAQIGQEGNEEEDLKSGSEAFNNAQVSDSKVLDISWANEISGSYQTVYLGYPEKLQVQVKMSQEGGTLPGLLYKSSNKKIAKVSNDGTVTPIKTGYAYIYCQVDGNSKFKIKRKIRVKKRYVSSVKFSGDSKEYLVLGDTIKLEPQVLPVDASNKKINWSTSNKKKATVSKDGVVTTKGTGVVKIYAKAADGSKKSAKCYLYIRKKLTPNSTKFIAHRGYSSKAPENTMEAYKLAVDNGFWGIESDVRLTGDGKFVMMHNESLAQMCNVDKNVQDLSLRQLKKLNITGGNNIDQYDYNLKIPTLKEYLTLCKNNNIVPIIEIKMAYQESVYDPATDIEEDEIRSLSDGDINYKEQTVTYEGDGQTEVLQMTDGNYLDNLYGEAKAIMGNSKYYFISFDYDTVKYLRDRAKKEGDSNIRFQHTVKSKQSDSTKTVKKYKSLGIGLDASCLMSETKVKKYRKYNVEVNYWTIDDQYEAWRAIYYGIDSITTNVILWDTN